MTGPLAQFRQPNVEEFFNDPILTVACVLLVVVSIGWILVSRLVARNMRRARLRRLNPPKPGEYQPPRDVWAEPPPG
jgi:hypothetical protein